MPKKKGRPKGSKNKPKAESIATTILFSNDLDLTANQLIKYYSLRFQIKFDFRDSRQFYGLSDFRNYQQTPVTNAANLSFTMTLLGKLVLKKVQAEVEV